MDKIKNMPKEVWNKIKTELSRKLPSHTISTWFDSINPIAFEGGELILEVPNQFFYDWIESHYRRQIDKSLNNLNLSDISTRLIYYFCRKARYSTK